MDPDDFDLNSRHRSETALQVLREGGDLEPRERGRLLDAMWEGWRQIMCIRLKATCKKSPWRQPEDKL